MTPLHTFGDCNQYGFTVTDAPQLMIMKLTGGKWGSCGLDSTVQEEIDRNGGVDATISMLFSIRRSQTPGKPYRTSTQKMEDEKAKRVSLEKARAARSKLAQEKREAKEEAKNEEIREANAKKMAANDAKKKLRIKKAQAKIEAEAEAELKKEETKPAPKKKAKKKTTKKKAAK